MNRSQIAPRMSLHWNSSVSQGVRVYPKWGWWLTRSRGRNWPVTTTPRDSCRRVDWLTSPVVQGFKGVNRSHIENENAAVGLRYRRCKEWQRQRRVSASTVQPPTTHHHRAFWPTYPAEERYAKCSKSFLPCRVPDLHCSHRTISAGCVLVCTRGCQRLIRLQSACFPTPIVQRYETHMEIFFVKKSAPIVALY